MLQLETSDRQQDYWLRGGRVRPGHEGPGTAWLAVCVITLLSASDMHKGA